MVSPPIGSLPTTPSVLSARIPVPRIRRHRPNGDLPWNSLVGSLLLGNSNSVMEYELFLGFLSSFYIVSKFIAIRYRNLLVISNRSSCQFCLYFNFSYTSHFLFFSWSFVWGDDMHKHLDKPCKFNVFVQTHELLLSIQSTLKTFFFLPIVIIYFICFCRSFIMEVLQTFRCVNFGDHTSIYELTILSNLSS